MSEVNEQQYFSFDPCGEFRFHDTAEAAQKAFEEALFLARESLADGTSDDNEQEICWGRVHQRVSIDDRAPTPEEQSQHPDILVWRELGAETLVGSGASRAPGAPVLKGEGPSPSTAEGLNDTTCGSRRTLPPNLPLSEYPGLNLGPLFGDTEGRLAQARAVLAAHHTLLTAAGDRADASEIEKCRLLWEMALERAYLALVDVQAWRHMSRVVERLAKSPGWEGREL